MNIDAERKAFEAWYTSERLAASSPVFAAAKMAKGGDGTYLDYQVGRSWQTWQAALASQGDVVAVSALEELADSWVNGGWRTGADYVNALQECADQLRAILNRGGK